MPWPGQRYGVALGLPATGHCPEVEILPRYFAQAEAWYRRILVAVDDLRALIDANPWQAFKVPAAAKRVVSFLRKTPTPLPHLPVKQEGATILAFQDRLTFTAYLRHPQRPVFMSIIQQTFGKDITTRT